MPKETFIGRYSLIIKRLEKGAATFEQIAKHLENESDIQDKNFIISKRTLQRDIKHIYSQLGFEIVNEKKGDKRYFIKSRPESQEHSQRLLEAYEMVDVLKSAQDYTAHIFFETRKPKGLEHFSGLFYAIRNKKTVSFTHYKYWDETLTDRTVHPLALKESQGRWYMIAIDKKDDKLKTFGLDRMNDIEISKPSFKNTYHYNLNELFKHSFGILNEANKRPQTIKLPFTYEQGQYVKTYPLHHSQKVIQENDEGVFINLYMNITHDFVMELLSYGEELTVLSPALLIKSLKNSYTNALRKYK